ncbi:hypothetical protein EUTSA_v10022072mg [Eutrema salsugineum]|uniref:Uncharacterized protein n=1 Tax=Eutrema salsugineum TaxID=72664 RepID=V4LGM9_EUTSA|nr:hypothetical protein EUTSA_v10022072mg [Eutrema salsugineum]
MNLNNKQFPESKDLMKSKRNTHFHNLMSKCPSHHQHLELNSIFEPVSIHLSRHQTPTKLKAFEITLSLFVGVEEEGDEASRSNLVTKRDGAVQLLCQSPISE